MKIWLSPVQFDSHRGRRPRADEIARALRIVGEHRAERLGKWKEIYG